MSDSNLVLSRCIDAVRDELKPDLLQLSFLFRSHVNDFLVGASILGKEESTSERFHFVARRLCELSREINFASPHGAAMPENLASNLSILFDAVASLIPENDVRLAAYKQNISFRHQELAGVD